MEELVPGVVFSEEDLNLERIPSDEGDDLGNFKPLRLSKFDKIIISNLTKDIESFLYTFKLMSKLVRSCQILNETKPAYNSSPYRMDNEEELGYVPIGDMTSLVQPNESVMKVLFGMRCSNKALRNEIGKLYAHVLFNDDRSIVFCKTIIHAINDATFDDLQNYERVLFCFLTMEDEYNNKRTEQCFKLLLKVAENNSTAFAFMENFTAMMIKFAKKNKKLRESFFGDKLVDKINKWLTSNHTPPISSVRNHSGVFKENKRNNRYSYDVIGEDMATIKEFNNKRKAELRSMFKKLKTWEDPDIESEDDLFEEDLKTGTMIDFEDSSQFNQWVPGVVTCNLGNIIKVTKEESDEMEVDGRPTKEEGFWINKDSKE